MELKMAIIGMGGMSEWHFKNIKEHVRGLAVVSGYDIRPETCKKRAKDWGVKIYAMPEELYADPDIDIVLVATPNDSHKDYVIACLKAGKNVICEKPVTMNVSELEEIIAVAKETSKLFSVHQNRRWDRDFLTVKKILADGLLTKPYVVESRVQGSLRLYGWRAFPQNGGGILLDWGVHLLDQMLDLIPQEVVSVYGHVHSMPGSQVDDSFTATLRFAGGCSCVVNVDTNCYIVHPRWHLSCEDGTAIVNTWECDGKIVKQADPNEMDWTEELVYTAAGPTRIMLPRPKETTVEIPLPDPGGEIWTEYYNNIVDTLNSRAKLIVTPEQALRVMKIIEAVFESARTGAAITTRI
ncbi:MAG: Gfo/Idh/MocA family oxidoreductase [Defluviitaleaceae bacterium]|nr:Gfo/Idh/MocA family oxidoreductase [Defluviitaleaceae bacterium]